MTKNQKLYFLILEVVFVVCSLMTFATIQRGSIQETIIAGAFIVSGLALFVWSFFLYRLHRSYAEVAWITLFLVVVISLFFPKL